MMALAEILVDVRVDDGASCWRGVAWTYMEFEVEVVFW